MPIEYDDLARFADRFIVQDVICSRGVGIPGSRKVHEYLNLASASGICDGLRVFVTYGKRFLHHRVDSVARRNLNYAPVVSSRINKDGLRMRLLDHVRLVTE